MAEVKKAYIDVDDCLFRSAEGFMDIFDRHGWLRGYSPDQIRYGENWGALMGVDPKEVQRRSDYIWDELLTLGFQPLPGAREELELLKRHGLGGHPIELRAATSRPRRALSSTVFLLVSHFPAIFSGVHFTGVYDGAPTESDYATTKEELYRRGGVDLAADDDIKHIQGALNAEVPIPVQVDVRRLHEDEPALEGVLRIHEWGGAYEKMRDFAQNR